MEYSFAYRRYHLPFRSPLRTAHGLWSAREGILLRLEARDGAVSYGEAAPIPWFGTETVDEVEEACRKLGEVVDDTLLDTVPGKLGCLRSAFASARTELAEPRDMTSRQVASLLPAGKAALDLIESQAEVGFRVFKWKVGAANAMDELGLLDDICAKLPDGARLRLDANGAWDRRTAERWLERCAERPVEYVEQPCFADASQGTALQNKTEDLLMGLANDYPTPLALDESLIRLGDITRWIDAGWSGFYVLKPSLLENAQAAQVKLAKAHAKVVFSSALETAIGAKAALQLAFSWTGHAYALGFGVWPLFHDPRMNGPGTAPFMRWHDVERLNEEATWNALP